jgi:KDO2-lipid IV(A) lauroyltransferase
MQVVDRDKAVPTLFRHLRHDRSVALLCDLNQKEGPLFADFFGVPAATVRTPGILAVRARKPVICGTTLSTSEPLRYRGLLAPPILAHEDADPDEEAERVVREMNLALESFVRMRPEEWNWIHPRWKTRPPDEARRPLR